GVLMTVTRTGQASTLDIVNDIKKALPKVLATIPPELTVTTLADQSIFVRASIEGVEREALIAAALTGLMILLFLGSWRSTLIVCISIPLSILASLSILSLLGQTINVMTLGGLALAVGILVDDATVAIENTHRNIALGKSLVRAVIDGGAQIAVPTLVSSLAICIVFVPVLLLTGTARYLFTPCWLLMCSRARWSRLWPISCLAKNWIFTSTGLMEKRPAARISSGACTISSTSFSKPCGAATWGCWNGRSPIAR